MKTLILAMSTLTLSLPVLASEMPASAKLIAQASGYSVNSGMIKSAGGSDKAFESAQSNIKYELDQKNAEYNCKTVYLVWRSPNSHSSCSGYDIFDVSCANTESIAVDAYCDPRSFADKVAVSAQQACEKEPKPECMSPRYMAMFNKLQPTQYINVK